MTVETEKVNRIIDRHDAQRMHALAILQDIQREYGFLPQDALEQMARRLRVPDGELYRLATFFKAFRLEPQGEHVVKVCLGTACHVIGGNRLLEHLERELDIEAGGTTPDGKITLEPVRCLGACALAPVMLVDEKPHGKVTSAKASRIIASLRKTETPAAPEETSRDEGPVTCKGDGEADEISRLESLDALNRLRARSQRLVSRRLDVGTTITVGMGTCGIAAGAREVMGAILEALDLHGLEADVTTAGCVAMCEKVPLVEIHQADEPAVTYGNITPERVPRLVKEHLVDGQMIQEWTVRR